MKPSELLRHKDWCQNFAATDKYGNIVGWASEDACAFCVAGAIYRCYGDAEYSDNVTKTLRTFLGVRYVSEWNDMSERTKDEVIAALEAIGH